MDIWDFISRYDRVKVDYDGRFGFQCVDLYRQYVRDVCGVTTNLPNGSTEPVAGAKDLVECYDCNPTEKRLFSLIKNYRAASRGDIIVYGATVGNPYGHVAIVIEPESDYAVIFEQDGFSQDGARIRKRDFRNCIGLLRFSGGAK